MKLLIVPAAFALALMAGGAAFAAAPADADNAYLYAQPSPFAVPQDAAGFGSMATGSDRRLDPTSQRASRSKQTYMAIPEHGQQDSSSPWSENGLFGPYGPE